MRTRASIREEVCSHHSVGGYMKIRKAVNITDCDLKILRRALRTRGVRIFNPNLKRLQASLEESNDLVRRLMSVLKAHGLLSGRTADSPVVLLSQKGCQQQQFHTDYNPAHCAEARVKPLGVILAAQDGAKWVTPRETVHLDQGDVLVFDGDVVHAGGAYENENIRCHLYLDSCDVIRTINTTYLTIDVDCA